MLSAGLVSTPGRALTDTAAPTHSTTVPYAGWGAQGAALAAAAAHASASLARCTSLERLRIVFSCRGFLERLGQSAGAASDGRSSQMWGGAMRALSAAMQDNTALTHLSLAAFPGQFPADTIAGLQAVLAAASARAAQRCAVLCGLRSGSSGSSPSDAGSCDEGSSEGCQLARLPAELLRKVCVCLCVDRGLELKSACAGGFVRLPGRVDNQRPDSLISVCRLPLPAADTGCCCALQLPAVARAATRHAAQRHAAQGRRRQQQQQQ